VFDWLIVGAGFTGATLADRLARERNQQVLIVERRQHVGGNAYDHANEHGILVHRYGPHIFHTKMKHVWDYLSEFTEWRYYFHHVLVVIDGQQVPLPFNLNTLEAVFPPTLASRLESGLIEQYGYGAKVPILKLRDSANKDMKFLADYVYEKIFYHYTRKQWGVNPEDLDPAVTGRVPVLVSRDDRYFQDPYQGIPARGYTAVFERMLDHPNIRLLLNTEYDDIKDIVPHRRTIYTGPIDAFFESAHGDLPYRSLRFESVTKRLKYYQEVATVNCPYEYGFTRITEWKHLTGQQHPLTTVTFEYPGPYVPGQNEPYYPTPQEATQRVYQRYCQEAAKLEGKVFFAGRLADYRYYNMDEAVARALEVFKKDIYDV